MTLTLATKTRAVRYSMLSSEEVSAHTLHRVSLRGDTGQYEVITLGTFGIDDPLQGVYDLEDLPQWMQSKLAVLRVCVDTEPENYVQGFGRRVDDETFYVIGEQHVRCRDIR